MVLLQSFCGVLISSGITLIKIRNKGIMRQFFEPSVEVFMNSLYPLYGFFFKMPVSFQSSRLEAIMRL